MVGEWETAATAVHEATGLDDPPVSAFELAVMCGLRLCPWGRGDAALVAKMIRYPRSARPTRQHGLVAHELAHWALSRSGEEDHESAARYVAGALMLPRRVFDRDLAQTWHIARLQERHPNASAEMIARRLVQLRSARAAVFDQGKLRASFRSLDLAHPPVTSHMRELAAEALCSGALAGEERAYAWPVIDPPWHRVIVVCAASGGE